MAIAPAPETGFLYPTRKPQITQMRSHDRVSVLRETIVSVLVFSGISFSPDGKILASASDEAIVRLWDVNSGKEIQTLKGHTSRVNRVSFSPDGKTLASASDDSTIILWNLNLDDLLVKGCGLIQGYLKNSPDVSPEDRRLCDNIKPIRNS
jgi:WD40 repeat protein